MFSGHKSSLTMPSLGGGNSFAYFSACSEGNYKTFSDLHQKYAQDFDPRYPRGRVPKKILQRNKIQMKAGISALVLAIIDNRIDIAKELVEEWGNAVTASEMILELNPRNNFLKFEHYHHYLEFGERGDNSVVIPSYSTPLMISVILERDEISRCLMQSENFGIGMQNNEGYCALDYIIISRKSSLLDMAVDTQSRLFNVELCKSNLYVKLAIQAANYSIFEYFAVICRESTEFYDSFGSLFAISRPQQMIGQLMSKTKQFLHSKRQLQMLSSEQENELETWINNLYKTEVIIQRICSIFSNIQLVEETIRSNANLSQLNLGVLRHCSSILALRKQNQSNTLSECGSFSKLRLQTDQAEDLDV